MHFTSEFMPKVDGGTMYYAIEARAPFLDQKIWEFAAALPPEVRFHGGRLKAVLREIARRRVGPEVAFRKKQGFTVPVEELAGGTLERNAGPFAGTDPSGRRGMGTARRAGGAAARCGEASRSVPIQLWRLLVLERWLARNAGS
jgi:asparagine synthase (glutamine-hydrolysing)